MRASRTSAGLFIALATGLASCRDAAPGPGSPVESRRSGASERESYRPPADGVLTPAQVQAFLRVREATARVIASPGEPAPPGGEDGISGATAARAVEMQAARELSVPVDEYLWVRERIVEAEAAALTAKLNADVLALLERTLASLRERRPAAPDDASRQLLDEQIASFEAEAVRVKREAGFEEPASVRANLRVLGPFRQKLSAIADELGQLKAATVAAPPSLPK